MDMTLSKLWELVMDRIAVKRIKAKDKGEKERYSLECRVPKKSKEK